MSNYKLWNMALKSSLLIVTVLAMATNAARALEEATPTFAKHQRDEPTPTVDFGSMPTCGVYYCVYPTTTEYPCPTTFPSPCPSGGGDNCSTVSLDCYCNLATPYQCAFHPCSWIDVMLLENWFNQTCPHVDPTVSYDFYVNSIRKFVPSCALDCIHTQTISYGCTSESKNCFCSHESLYGCTEGCSQKDNSTIADWLAATCQISGDKAAEVVQDDTAYDSSYKDGGPMPPSPPQPLHWYEIMPIAVFAVSTLVFLVGLVMTELPALRKVVQSRRHSAYTLLSTPTASVH
jgi:hypothetical protein